MELHQLNGAVFIAIIIIGERHKAFKVWYIINSGDWRSDDTVYCMQEWLNHGIPYQDIIIL